MVCNKKLCYFVFLTLLYLSGCVSYQYKGESCSPNSGEIQIFNDPQKVEKEYTILGEAVVSGDYQNVSRDRLMAKLIDEAKKNGANGIMLINQQIIPDSEYRSTPRFTSAYSFDDTNDSWNQLNRDVDLNFGSIRNKKSAAGNGSHLYKRVINAKFIRFSK